MLTQEQCDEEEGEQKEEQERLLKAKKKRMMMMMTQEGYVSSKDPFPREARRRPTEEDLDKDFDLNEEVGKKP